MSHIIADCLITRWLFSGDRQNSLMDSLRLQCYFWLWAMKRIEWGMSRLEIEVCSSKGLWFPCVAWDFCYSLLEMRYWRYTVAVWKVKVLNQYLGINCKRIARILKPRAFLTLHHQWFWSPCSEKNGCTAAWKAVRMLPPAPGGGWRKDCCCKSLCQVKQLLFSCTQLDCWGISVTRLCLEMPLKCNVTEEMH